MAWMRRTATVKIGRYRAMLTPPDFAWTGHKSPANLLKAGDLLRSFTFSELSGSTAKVQLEQYPGPQAALLAIDNASGEIKAMVGGYGFEDSKFNRATQAQRQAGSSFKVYVYAAAMEAGYHAVRHHSGRSRTRSGAAGRTYSPHNYDEKYEGMHHAAPRAGRFAQRAGGAARSIRSASTT